MGTVKFKVVNASVKCCKRSLADTRDPFAGLTPWVGKPSVIKNTLSGKGSKFSIAPKAACKLLPPFGVRMEVSGSNSVSLMKSWKEEIRYGKPMEASRRKSFTKKVLWKVLPPLGG